MVVDLVLQTLAFLAGIFLVIVTLSAAIRSFVLPRNETVLLNALVFRGVRFFFDLAAGLSRTYSRRDRIEAHYAPVALVALPVVWLGVICAGFTLIYWGLGERDWLDCYQLSGSSLLTLGTHKTRGALITVFTFAEATLGLLLMTLLISYLPTIYQAFARRELVVARLELRAGAPASAYTLLTWLNRSGSLLDDDDQWERWEEWFMEIEESHTSLPIISFFRSPQPGRSWVTAAGLILDTAALMFSVVEGPRSRQAELTFKAGCISVNRVFRFFDQRARTAPSSLIDENDPVEDPTRAGFEQVYDELLAEGMLLRPNRDEAWEQYHTLRGRYHEAIDFLAKLTVSPEMKPV
ncbi:hypothetical protein [Hymenobacter glacieicola]|uniref:Two pore domain potassium channel family protein n=1 Tax=Hymenobacter glacieicola TaxID=1562124 RepID=A0ABQ1WX81_9BACT|nr:hypothetical protein [Hymenobacter glacieicola]GGG45938.1 hypothetical protein GCM10011378_22680 [Hymenobacter glacieicola]